MDFKSILEDTKIELLTEAGIRIPAGTKAFKILHHDDADGLGSAKMARQQIHNQVFKQFKKENPGKTDKEIKKIIDSRITTTEVTDSSKPYYVANALKKDPNQMILVVDFDRFSKFGDKVEGLIKKGAIDFHSDHHQTDEPTTKGGGKTGATEFRSDTEHLATKTVSKGINPKTVLAFSDTDSATFRESLMKELGLEKSDDKKNKVIKELFLILSQISRSKKDRKATDHFIKHSGNTLTSMISYARKLKKAIEVKNKGNAEFKKDSPDMKVVDAARNELIKTGFKDMASDIAKGERVKEMKSAEDFAKKNIRDFARSQDLYKGKGKYIIFSNLQGRDQPSRYLGYTIPTGDKNPEISKYLAMIRNWEGMGFMQASLSPEAPKEIKDNIDLPDIFKRALAKTRKKLGTKYNNWAFDIIEKEMGGHKGISNIGGFGTLGLMPKKFREELKGLRPFLNKMKSAKAIKGSSSKAKENKAKLLATNPAVKAKMDRIQELEKMKKEASVKKSKFMAAFRNEMTNLLDYEIDTIMKKKKQNESTNLMEQIIKNSN